MNKKGVVLYMHVHQPWRVDDYTVFDTGVRHSYYDGISQNDRNNQRVLEKVANKSYRPMNALLLKLLNKHPDFKLSLSITGTFIEQCEKWAPDVLESFQALTATGQVEIVAETYYHSLAFFYSRHEFEAQVQMHRDKVYELFGVVPTAFRNTELAYNDQLGEWADKAGYQTILAEGWDPILGWRSPNHVYQPPETKNIKLLLKNYRLSDDVAFRFSNRDWAAWPLHADTYTDWLEKAIEDGPLVNLFMDYETFGEHQWEDTGIFDFFEEMVSNWLSNPDRTFYTVTEASQAFEVADTVSMPETVTWADAERDLSAWLGNTMQHEMMKYLYAVEQEVMHTHDTDLISDWRRLQTSDHVYYMCTKWFTDGDVHAYFSPYDSPYDAFLYGMNVIRDIRYRLMEHQIGERNG